MNERRAVQKFDLIVAEYQKIVLAKFAQHSVDVDWRKPQRICKFALRQWAEKAVLVAGSIDPGPVPQFEQKVGNAYKRTSTADADEMLDQDGPLPRHQFHECHGETGRFEQAFGKMIQGDFENGKLRNRDQGVVVEAESRSETQEVALHRKVEDLAVTFGEVAIDAAPAVLYNMNRVGPVSLTADNRVRRVGFGGNWQNGEHAEIILIENRANGRAFQKMAQRSCFVGIYHHRAYLPFRPAQEKISFKSGPPRFVFPALPQETGPRKSFSEGNCFGKVVISTTNWVYILASPKPYFAEPLNLG